MPRMFFARYDAKDVVYVVAKEYGVKFSKCRHCKQERRINKYKVLRAMVVGGNAAFGKVREGYEPTYHVAYFPANRKFPNRTVHHYYADKIFSTRVLAQLQVNKLNAEQGWSE